MLPCCPCPCPSAAFAMNGPCSKTIMDGRRSSRDRAQHSLMTSLEGCAEWGDGGVWMGRGGVGLPGSFPSVSSSLFSAPRRRIPTLVPGPFSDPESCPGNSPCSSSGELQRRISTLDLVSENGHECSVAVRRRGAQHRYCNAPGTAQAGPPQRLTQLCSGGITWRRVRQLGGRCFA